MLEIIKKGNIMEIYFLYYKFFGYNKYSGEFKDGKKNGFGKEFDKRGNLVYQGKYFQDKRI